MANDKFNFSKSNRKFKKNPDKDEKGRGAYRIYVRAQAIEGKANKEVIESFAEYFKVPKSKISVIKDEGKKEKILQIND